MQDEQIDVLVIGSGAAGGALTWRLSGQGVKVVCLEQGGWVEPSSFPSAQKDYESHLFRGDFHLDPNGAAIAAKRMGDEETASKYFEMLLALTALSNSERDEVQEAKEFIEQVNS